MADFGCLELVTLGYSSLLHSDKDNCVSCDILISSCWTEFACNFAYQPPTTAIEKFTSKNNQNTLPEHSLCMKMFKNF